MDKQKPNNQDYLAYMRVATDDVYWTVGSYNLFMMCQAPNREAFSELPDGFSFRLCRFDELELWKRLAVDEPYVDYVTDYFDKVLAKLDGEFFRRCTFVCDMNDKPVATCFLWSSYGTINTVEWFRTLPEYEGRGIGRALLSKLLRNTDYPVYLHTQPTSARAIKLYSDFGFKFITNPVVGFRENNLAESLPILKKVMPEVDFAALRTVQAPVAFLEAAKSSEIAEF
jgi:GNAT superfamily N-acetyltransferase